MKLSQSISENREKEGNFFFTTYKLRRMKETLTEVTKIH